MWYGVCFVILSEELSDKQTVLRILTMSATFAWGSGLELILKNVTKWGGPSDIDETVKSEVPRLSRFGKIT